MTPRIQLDKQVDNRRFKNRFSCQFSPKEADEFMEQFEENFSQIGYFCDGNGDFNYPLFAKWLELRFFVDTNKRVKFSNLHEYIERILTFFIGSSVLALWHKLNRYSPCPEEMSLIY